jgi:uncharacterized protein (TIGR02594 family)
MIQVPLREYLYIEASKYYGLKEIKGNSHNPIILNWAKDIGVTWYTSDEIPWCSLFINWICWKYDVERSGSLLAKSWLNVGQEIKIPELGDLVVFWRGSIDSEEGHVAFFTGIDNYSIHCLGANQNDTICIRPYPIERKLAYIRLLPLDIAV